MSEASIRGHWLTGGAKFVRTHYPPEAGELLLDAFPRPLKSLLTEIQPVSWYPRAFHVDILRAIAAAQRGEAAVMDGLVAYGNLIASDLAAGALRPLLPLLTPKLLGKRLPQLWASEHQGEGRLEVDIAQSDEGRLALTILAPGYEHISMVTLGFVAGLVRAIGKKDVTVKQTGWSMAQPAPASVSGEVRWS